jgi:predicted ATPase
LGSVHLGLLADVRSRLGHHNAAKAAFADAFAALARVGDMPVAPELYRLRAASRLRESVSSKDDAVSDLSQAYKIALEQGAKSHVLRAARDLARIWAENNERTKSFDFLTPIYNSFTEGRDTQDLKEAKLILDQ